MDGVDERDPFIPHTDHEDDDDGDTTGPFKPGASSSRRPREFVRTNKFQ